MLRRRLFAPLSYYPAGCCGDACCEQGIERVSPPGFPGGRQDEYGQFCFVVAPDAVGIGRLYMKGVFARTQVVVISRPVAGVCILPGGVETIQAVSVVVVDGTGIIQCGKLDGEIVVPIQSAVPCPYPYVSARIFHQSLYAGSGQSPSCVLLGIKDARVLLGDIPVKSLVGS